MAPSNFLNRNPRSLNRRHRHGSISLSLVLIGVALALSLILGLSVLSNVNENSNALNPNSLATNPFDMYVGKDGDISDVSIEESTAEYRSNRQKAIQAAKKLNEKRLLRENYEQGLRNRRKEDYETKLEEAELSKLKKREDLLKEEEEMKYYHYYEDSNDDEATAIGMTYRSDLLTFQRFVGSLRSTGYGGNIIIGVDEIDDEVEKYLKEQRVTIKRIKPTQCTFETAKDRQKCYLPYPHIKKEWAHFPLTRDWLSSCDTCTGPVIFTTIEDTFFQKNPFGAGMPVVRRLHVYEQHPSVDIPETSAGILLKACLEIDLAEEMKEDDPDMIPFRGILSGSTALGTRDDVIDFLGLVYSVVREWMQRSSCHFQHSSTDDGMAIVNFLRIKNRLPYRTRIMPHRTGIVNNIEFEGNIAYEAHIHLWKFRGLTKEDAENVPYDGGMGRGWIDKEYMVTDEDGFFIDVFFQKSSIVTGYKSFGKPYLKWLDNFLQIKGNDDGQKSQRQSESYYIEEGEAIELDPKPVRKEKIEKTGEVVVEKTKLEDMYYEGRVKSDNEVVHKIESNAKPVPVEETHEKIEVEAVEGSADKPISLASIEKKIKDAFDLVLDDKHLK